MGDSVLLLSGLRSRLLFLGAVLGRRETGAVCEQLAHPYLAFSGPGLFDPPEVQPAEGEPDQVLMMIADLYGVDRSYLTDIGSDPAGEARISDQLYNDYFGRGFERSHWFTPAPSEMKVVVITEQEEIVTRLGRHALYRETAMTTLMHLATIAVLGATLGGIIIAPDLAPVWKWVLGFCVSAGVVYAVIRGIGDVRLQAAALRLGRDAFTAAYHQNLRHQIARNLATYLRDTDLPYEFFYALFRHNVPVGYGTLDRLTGRKADARRSLLRDAATFKAPSLNIKQPR